MDAAKYRHEWVRMLEDWAIREGACVDRSPILADMDKYASFTAWWNNTTNLDAMVATAMFM